MGTTLIVAAAVIALIVATTVSRPAPAPARGGLSLAAYVTQSAQKTLAERTVSMTTSGTFSVGGKHVTVHGAGQIDYTADAMALDFSYSLPGSGTGTVKEIMVNGTVYASASTNGKPQALKDGRHWIKLSAPQGSAKPAPAEDDPFAMLAAIAKAGNTTVREIGTRSIGGVRCTGYRVTAQGASFTLWIDSAGLVREMSIGMQMSVDVQAGNTAFGGNLVMDFTKYGVPVHITPPAPSDTSPL
jgi:hypothetical protein